MSKSIVKMKLANLKFKIKNAVAELKSEKFADTIKDVIVEGVRNNSINPKTGREFPPLKESTIKRRKNIAKYNKTHPAYSESKPNLTITGRLLDSIKARITARSNGILFSMDVSGVHKSYKGKNKLIGQPVQNKAIRDGLAKIGRDPLGLNDTSINKIVRLLTIALQERLKK